jgi:glycosyltransferase involved in cell wall biosynthesis
MPHRVLVDGTPLRGVSGHRGIGRVIHDLLHGLEDTRDEWRRQLDVRVICELGVQSDVRADLGAAAEWLQPGTGRSLLARRRLFTERCAREQGARLVHLMEALGTPLGSRVDRVVTCHDLIPLRMPDQYLGRGVRRITRKSLDRRRYASARRVVAISELTKRDLVDLLAIDPARIDVVPNGIDVAHFQRPLDDLALLARFALDRPWVVYVGYCDRRKDPPALVRTIEEVQRTKDVDLVWAGRLDESDVAFMRKQLAEAGCEHLVDRMKRVGFVSDDELAALYRNAVAHLFLSRLEGFGLSVAEAMACGCPVIVARGSGADAVGGDAAIVVEPGDFRAAASAIVRLTDAAERERHRAAGVARAAQFDRKAMARGYVESWLRALTL